MNSSLRLFRKMSSPAVLNKIKANADNANIMIKNMKSELVLMKKEVIVRALHDLETENKQLRDEIEATKRRLIQLETARGVKQIPVPSQTTDKTCKSPTPAIQSVPKPATAEPKQKKEKPTKADKPKKAADKSAASVEAPADVGRLDMRIGLIKEVAKHPDADSLYVSKIDCGETNPRTVVSGLVKFVPRDQLEGRLVVLLCNLKPAKMRGVTSEAMVMCASTPDKVEVLSPPPGCQPGDLVHCEGYDRVPDAQLNPKKKIFETCAPDLKTDSSLIACYKGAAIHVPGKGNVVAQTLTDVQVK